jgi:hypothetical protein
LTSISRQSRRNILSCASLPSSESSGLCSPKSSNGVAGHAHEFDRLAVLGFLPHHHRHVDAARVVAGAGVFVAVAVPDHLEQIAVFEGLERLHIVDLLQAQDVGAGLGYGQRGELAHVVCMRDGSALFEQPVFGLVLDLEQRQRSVLVKMVAEA